MEVWEITGTDRFLGEIDMARLADDVINRIKQDASLLRLVEGKAIT